MRALRPSTSNQDRRTRGHLNTRSRWSNQDRRTRGHRGRQSQHSISDHLGESQHAIGTQFERSSDKCLVVISQRCRSPHTASDSSSSCLHVKPEDITMQSRGSNRCAISHPSLSSDKCLVVISQRCRSPHTASDSSSSCLQMSCPILGDYSPPGHQRPSEAISDHQRPSGAHLQAKQVTIHPLAHQSIPRDAAVVVDRLTHGSRALGQARMSVSEGGHEGGGVVGRRSDGLRT